MGLNGPTRASGNQRAQGNQGIQGTQGTQGALGPQRPQWPHGLLMDFKAAPTMWTLKPPTMWTLKAPTMWTVKGAIVVFRGSRVTLTVRAQYPTI